MRKIEAFYSQSLGRHVKIISSTVNAALANMKILPQCFNLSIILTQCINSILHWNTSPTDRIFASRGGVNFNSSETGLYQYGCVERIDGCNFYFMDDFAKFLEYQVHLAKLEMRTKYKLISTSRILLIENTFPLKFAMKISKVFQNAIYLSSTTGNIYKYSSRNDSLVKITNCENYLSQHSNLFPSKILKFGMISIGYSPNNIYTACDNCTRPGIEIEILKLLMDHLGMTYKFERISNLGQVNRLFDISVGGASYLQHEFVTQSYVEDFMKFFVPMSQKLERWRYILLVFDTASLIGFLITFMANVFIFIVIKYLQQEQLRCDLIQFIFVIFLGRTGRYRTRDIGLEFLIFSMVFWSAMINYLFCSKLRFLLNGINYENQIESPDDIIRNGLSVGITHPKYIEILQNIDEFANYSLNNIKDCRFNRCVPFITKKNMAFFAAVRPARHLIRNHIDPKTGQPYLKEMKKSYFTRKIAAVIMRNHPFFPVLNKHVKYLIESGITEQIVKKYEIPYLDELTMEPIRSLKFEHIIAPLFILTIGLTISLIVFFFELKK
ncbi:hypothetical protein WA026_022647 [Henosepilachna vigintioctopunctata]|uniref:Ionotropic receptor n=1 Tax=Henosepilachna vigintioctopunctata TaxID=420089 RepID=A0AAW1U4C9_9CUCU